MRKQLVQCPKPTCRASLALSMRWFVSARSVASKSGAPSSALSRWNLLDMLSSDSAFCAAEADRGALLSRAVRLDLASSIAPGGVPQREELLGRAARGPPKPILMLWERVRGRTRPADSFELYKVVSPFSFRSVFSSVLPLPLISLVPLQLPVSLSIHPPHLYLFPPSPSAARPCFLVLFQFGCAPSTLLPAVLAPPVVSGVAW